MTPKAKAIMQIQGLLARLASGPGNVDDFVFIRDTLIERLSDYGQEIPASLACPPDDDDCKPKPIPPTPPPGGP